MSWQAKSATPPPGYRYGPRYKPSWESILRGAAYILRGKSRSLAHDSLFAIANMSRPPLVRGIDLIPETGQVVVVANHYERPGLWMAWPALLISHALWERTGQDTHWIAIEEWESLTFWGIPIPRSVIREAFRRAFAVYGIIAMPPMDDTMAARAGAMREAAHEVRAGKMLGMMPEATVGETPELLEAREGVGAFLLLLARQATHILPVGLYEENERLIAHVGAPLSLEVPGDVPKERKDAWARRRVMLAIRDLLPEPLWGAYKNG